MSLKLDPDALAVLEEQRSFLRSSLQDLEEEHTAGDLDDIDYYTLKADYNRRLTAVTEAIDEGKAAFASVPRRDPRRVALIAAAVIAFAVVCGAVVANLAGRRNPGDSLTGETPADVARRQLPDCYAAWFNDRDLPGAATCFDEVAADDPSNLEARTYGAGLRIMALDPDDQTFVQALAVLVDVAQTNPDYGDPHAFLAQAWFSMGQLDSAKKELDGLAAQQTSTVAQQVATAVRDRLP